MKSLLVTSSVSGEGKTTTICNLALVMAQTEKKVLLMDGDLRKSSVHRAFRISNEQGLSNVLAQNVDYETVIQRISDAEIDIMTAGPTLPNPSEFLGSKKIKQLLKQLQSQYDMILIDSPPILPITDGQLLSKCVDGVLFVIRSGKTKLYQVKKAKSHLDLVGAHLIGTVLNNKKFKIDRYYSYSSHNV